MSSVIKKVYLYANLIRTDLSHLLISDNELSFQGKYLSRTRWAQLGCF